MRLAKRLRLRRRYKTLLHNFRFLQQVWRMLNGIYPRSCNICGHSGMFKAHGMPPRIDALCPSCKSLERHRHQALWIKDHEAELRGKRILHFAPEGILRKIYRGLAATYACTNIRPGDVDLILDIERIDQPDASWDVVVANHVLEHVDDRKALKEIHRILTPGGLAILSFPQALGFERTYENPAIVSPAERNLHFGQGDHVRFYGADAGDRIAEAGFQVTVFSTSEPFVHRHSIARNERCFLARKA